MGYSIEFLNEYRALLVTWHEDLNFMVEGEALTRDILTALDAQDEPVYFIGDMRRVQMNFDELMAASQASARGNNAIFKHPKIKRAFSATHSKAVEMAAKGLKSEVFNNTDVTIVDSPEAAFEIIRKSEA